MGHRDRAKVRTTTMPLDERVIRATDLVACPDVFIDARNPGSSGKLNYALIGPGVSEESTQYVHISEAHGFNLGAAAMPSGTVNSLHLHFTPEVFVNLRGDWLFRWGNDGTDGELLLHEGDVVSMPTWLFRGFSNVGGDDGMLLAVLGGDDTGGVIWAPSVLRAANANGLGLSSDNRVVDLRQVDSGTDLVEPLNDRHLATLRSCTISEMLQRTLRTHERTWLTEPWLCSSLPGGGVHACPVIGRGTIEHRYVAPLAVEAHGFSVAWVAGRPGTGVLQHRVSHQQAVVVRSGHWSIQIDVGDEQLSTTLGPWDTLSIPSGAARSFVAVDDEPGELLLITEGDGRIGCDWADDVTLRAGLADRALDPNGCVVPLSALPPLARRSGHT